MNTLGNRIKHIRGAESQESFATKIGVSKGSLGGYERDENSPSAEAILKICFGAEISVEWLMTGRGSMRRDEATEPHTQPLQAPQSAPLEQGTTCKGCLKLVEKLIVVEEERQRISTAFVESMQKNLVLSEENGQLRLENLKLTHYLDTTKQMCKEYAAKFEAAEPSLFAKPQNIPSNDAVNLK